MTSPVNEQDDDDIYGGVEVGKYKRPQNLQSKFESFRERVQDGGKEFLGQGAKNFTAGLLGSYGDLASLARVNGKEGQINPGEKAQYNLESDILDKMNKPGYKPSASEIYALSGDDDLAPRYSRLPQTGEVKEFIEDVGGPGSPIYPEGEWAARTGQIYGNSVAFGQLRPEPAIAAGSAGHVAKALGAGPIGQMVAEIGALVISQGKGANPLTSTNPAIKGRIDYLRSRGYTDQEITLAINASKSGSNQVKNAKATSASEKAFEETLGKSERLMADILEDAFPGVGKGAEHIQQVASEAYGKIAESAKNITITNHDKFRDAAQTVIKQLENTLGENTQAAPFIKKLKDAYNATIKKTKNTVTLLDSYGNPIEKVQKNAPESISAETYMNFYKELNAMGEWSDPKNAERLINHVKDSIKSTFRNAGPEGKKLALEFEEVNRGIQRGYQAKAATDLIEKVTTVEGIKWDQMLKLFDKQKNWDVFEKALGRTQTKNLRQIAKVGKEVGDFRDSLGKMQQGGKLSGWVKTAKGAGFLYAITNGHYKTAAGLVGQAVSNAAFSRLQTRLLTDPKFQNITLRTLDSIKSASPAALQRASNAFREVAMEEGIDVDSF